MVSTLHILHLPPKSCARSMWCMIIHEIGLAVTPRINHIDVMWHMRVLELQIRKFEI